MLALPASAEPPRRGAWHAGAMDLSNERVREWLATNGPVGAWHTYPGTHQRLFDDEIRFDADGSGEMRLRSLLGGEHHARFRWRYDGHGVVSCQPIYDQPILSNTGEPEVSDWFRIPFRFERATSDVGTFWVLRETDASGFWELMYPLVPA